MKYSRQNFITQQAWENWQERAAQRKLGLQLINIGYKEFAKRFPANGVTIPVLKQIVKRLKKIA